MIPEPLLLLALALLGGAVALDGTSVGQFMVSRPLVAATLGGLAAGRPAEGILVGVALEALHLAVLPVGAATYPEAGPPAVAAGALFALTAQSYYASTGFSTAEGPYAALLLIVLFTLGWEWVGGRTVVALRHYNARFDGVEPGGTLEPAALERRHWTPVALDFARGTFLTVAAVVLLGALLGALETRLMAFPPRWAALAVGAAIAAGTASGLRLFGRARWPFFAAGAALGALWLFVR